MAKLDSRVKFSSDISSHVKPTSPASSSFGAHSSASSVTTPSVDHVQNGTVQDDGIAIIGFSLKFSGNADSVESFWDIMMDAGSTAMQFPAERMNHQAYYSADTRVQGTIRAQRAHFLKESLAAFDSAFFGASTAEASAMDPQQRFLLETTYRALENAGISKDAIYDTDTSVHTGCFTADYLILAAKDPEMMPKYTATGMAGAMLSNRISSFFNLTGPSITIDTACSSSLVALNQACECLNKGVSSMGVVAGCNLIFALDNNIALSNMGFLSPDGICHSFDHRANGYSRSEGFGVVIIKRMSDALRDGDTIRAVIRASGVNQDGNTPLAQPSKDAQARLIVDTYRKAGLDPLNTRYVEAHGTGTAVGDPLEAQAIGLSFGIGRPKGDGVHIGSLKSNFGHLEGAAGIAGIIKSILVLERGIIPPLAGFERANPEVDVEFLNINFPTVPTLWPERGLRRISVNSFGFGGTNAHVILEDACHYMKSRGLRGRHCTRVTPQVALQCTPPSDGSNNSQASNEPHAFSMPYVITWSAHEESSLKRMLSQYAHWFVEGKDRPANTRSFETIADILNQRRTLFAWRSFTVVQSLSDLRAMDASSPIKASAASELSMLFVFTGQGSQWCGMGKELFVYDVYRQSVHDAMSFLMTLGCYSNLTGALKGDFETLEEFHEPAIAQPLCTVLQVALVDLLSSLNLLPTVVVGHSSGEIAAAYATGAISRQAAWKIAYYRGLVSQQVARSPNNHGAMISVGLSEHEAENRLAHLHERLGKCGNLAIACVNSPSNVTVSGNSQHVRDLKEKLEHEAVFSRLLRVPVAYHGPHMQAVSARYLELIGNIAAGNASNRRFVNMISSVTGERISNEELRDPSYWVRNLVSQVKFSQAIQTAFVRPRPELTNKLDLSHRNTVWATDILEVGPHAALSGPIRETLRTLPHAKDIAYRAVLVRDEHACRTMMNAIAHLHCRGYPVRLSKTNVLSSSKDLHLELVPSLPEYPFNHSTHFWYESRISKELRFRQNIRNPFLGTPIADWNVLDARWRCVITHSNSPWLADHQINSKVVFPAAGMLTMVIEAAYQLSDTRDISAIELRNVLFHSALDIASNSEGVEVQTQLFQCQTDSENHGRVHDFFLRAYKSEWKEICRGTVQVFRKEPNFNEVDGKDNDGRLYTRALEQFEHTSALCVEEAVTGNQLYDRMWKFGYHFGQAFRRMTTSSHSKTGEATAKVDVFQTSGSDVPTIIHPASLDGILQIMVPGRTQGGKDDSWSLSLPTRIGKIWISREGFRDPTCMSVDVAIKIESNGPRMTKSNIVALAKDGSLRAFIEGIETTSISQSLALVSASTARKSRICWSIDYKPDVEAMERAQLRQYLTRKSPNRSLSSRFQHDLNLMTLAFLNKVHCQISSYEAVKQDDHLNHYYQWLSNAFKDPDVPRTQIAALSHDSESLRSLYELGTPRERQVSDIYWRIGHSLLEVLRHQVDPLELLFQEDDLARYYDAALDTAAYLTPLARYLELLVHRNPSMKILEIGAGTGSTTRHILHSLAPRGTYNRTSRFSKYLFTDISPSFFEKASGELQEFSGIEYKRLDIESDPVAQSFEAESFDLVIASLVLHATRSLDETIVNVRRLLKPKGKLILLEVTNPHSVPLGFLFGLLPGWWLSQEAYRRDRFSPAITQHEWHTILAAHNFTGVDQVFHDQEGDSSLATSLIISTKLVSQPDTSNTKFSIVLVSVVQGLCMEDNQLANKCRQVLQKDGHAFSEVCLRDLRSLEGLPGSLLIFIDSSHLTFISNSNEELFSIFRNTMCMATNILWVTSHLQDNKTGAPNGAMHGLARTIRSENAALNFTIFETSLESSQSNTLEMSKIISQCLRPVPSNDLESEIVQKNSVLQIPRVVEDVEMNEKIYEHMMPHVRRKVRFGEANLRLTVQTTGLLDSLSFVQGDTLSLSLDPLEVEVRVFAAGLNFKDCLVALGRIPGNSLGSDCAGVIERAGSKSKYKQGERVVVATLDAFRPLVRCSELLVARIPDFITYHEAAKLSTNFLTAYHSLVDVGRIQNGETVLIHAGAGGTGQAAIQIAHIYGAKVIATVGSKLKKDLLMSRYGIPEDHIFYSRDASFAEGVKTLTSERGVDLVLNCLAGAELRASWSCVAPYGRFIEIGKRDVLSHERLDMFQFGRNVSFTAIDLAAMIQERPHVVQRVLEKVVNLLAERRVAVASPLKVFSIHEIEEAFRYLQSGANPGSVAIDIDQDAVVEALIPPSKERCFEPNATYVLSGGMGGQGRSIARWMARKGAKNLLMLSRSGPIAEDSKIFLAEMQKAGVATKAPACDVADPKALQQSLEEARGSMPPIKGCIQAAMVLRDALFESMSYSDWIAAIEPKVAGSWNLHEQLPADLDFFILLSSCGGIFGSTGQANYSAGNTYQDSLAAFRVSKGLKAVSLNLSAMSEDGYLASRTDLLGTYAALKYVRPMSQTELFPVLEYYCNPDLPIEELELKSQVIMGLTPPSDTSAKLDIPLWMERPLFSHLRQMGPMIGAATSSTTDKQSRDLDLTTLKAMTSRREAGGIVSDAIREKLSRVLSREATEIDTSKPMYAHGVDSLVAVELRNWFLQTVKADISVFEILGAASIDILSSGVAEKLEIGMV